MLLLDLLVFIWPLAEQIKQWKTNTASFRGMTFVTSVLHMDVLQFLRDHYTFLVTFKSDFATFSDASPSRLYLADFAASEIVEGNIDGRGVFIRGAMST